MGVGPPKNRGGCGKTHPNLIIKKNRDLEPWNFHHPFWGWVFPLFFGLTPIWYESFCSSSLNWWFGFMGSPYKRDCYLGGTPIRIPKDQFTISWFGGWFILPKSNIIASENSWTIFNLSILQYDCICIYLLVRRWCIDEWKQTMHVVQVLFLFSLQQLSSRNSNIGFIKGSLIKLDSFGGPMNPTCDCRRWMSHVWSTQWIVSFRIRWCGSGYGKVEDWKIRESGMHEMFFLGIVDGCDLSLGKKKDLRNR